MEDFWNTDMTGKVLYKATFKDLGQHKKVACFKVMPRSQVSHKKTTATAAVVEFSSACTGINRSVFDSSLNCLTSCHKYK